MNVCSVYIWALSVWVISISILTKLAAQVDHEARVHSSIVQYIATV